MTNPTLDNKDFNYILGLNFVQLKEKFINLELKPSFVIKVYLNQLEKHKNLNSLITICDYDVIQKQALLADEHYINGTYRFLEGMPITIKDLFCTKGILTTAGSAMLSNFIPDYDAFVSAKALEQGAIMLGKNNMDEFAMGATNKYSAFGPSLNPINSEYVTGGSSGGSASAVASNICLFSIGSDTGGSVRQPAAFCGIVGIRPTYGRCSRRGMIAFCSTLDQAGIFGRDVTSAAALLQTIMGHDPFDATSTNLPVPNLMNLKGNIKGKKIGILTDLFVTDPSIKEYYKQTQKQLTQMGAILTNIDIPYMKDSLAVYYIIAPVEAASNLARYDGIRYGTKGAGNTYQEQCKNARQLFGDEAKRRILLGTYFASHEGYSTYFEKAQKVKKALTMQFNKAFEEVDLLLSPTTPHTAFRLNEQKSPVELYYEDYYTCPVNLAGLCGISLPVGLADNGMPVGMQLIGPAFGEEQLINAALALETSFDFNSMKN